MFCACLSSVCNKTISYSITNTLFEHTGADTVTAV